MTPPAVPRTRPRRPSRRLLAAAGLAFVLAGCGAVQPGVAARVGEETVTDTEVDRAAADICTLSEPQLSSSGQQVPFSLLRTRALALLTIAAIARQVAEEYDVQPGTGYRTQVAEFERTAETLPEEVRDTYVELSAAVPYAEAVKREAGRVSLAADGVADPSGRDARARGEQIFDVWPVEHDVRIDPRYGVRVVDGDLVPADTDVSYPVSPTALAAKAEQLDQAAVANLPATQRCG